MNRKNRQDLEDQEEFFILFILLILSFALPNILSFLTANHVKHPIDE